MYQKTWLGLSVQPTYNAWVNIIDYANVESLIKASYGNIENNHPHLFSSGIGAEIRYNEGYFQIKYCQSNTVRQVNYFIVQYTKTTDAPGSGKYVPSGAPAIHYTTDEQIIGTWIDGKPIYQKTVDCGALPNATSKTVENSIISNVKRVIKIGGYAYSSNSGIDIPIPFVDERAGNTIVRADYKESSGIRIGTNANLSDYTESYLTLQYTKTTD